MGNVITQFMWNEEPERTEDQHIDDAQSQHSSLSMNTNTNLLVSEMSTLGLNEQSRNTPNGDALDKPLYQDKSYSDKGIGMIATASITPGQLVLAEAPLVTIPAEALVELNFFRLVALSNIIMEELSMLPKKMRSDYFALHNQYQPAQLPPVIGIWSTNAFALGGPGRIDDGDFAESGVFNIISRFNHSCSPNAENVWCESSRSMEIRALQTITVGTEITISYITNAQELKYEVRKDALPFDCLCSACSLAPHARASDDALRQRVDLINRSLNDPGSEDINIIHSPGLALAVLFKQLQRVREHRKTRAKITGVYDKAHEICVAHGDLARGSAFMLMSMATYERFGGPRAAKEAAKVRWLNPEQNELYRYVSDKWQTSVQEELNATRAMDVDQKWLWARAVL